MATEYRIRVDLAGLLGQVQQAVAAGALPRLAQAVSAVAERGAADWKESIYRAKLWSGEKQAYMASVQWQMTGPFSALIWSDYKHAEAIETGRPPRDMKQMLNTSLKVRTSKDGSRYLIIPMRHNVPGSDAHAPSMPQHVYDLAQALQPSKIIGQGQRPSGTGAYDMKTRKRLMVNRNRYQWGGSLPAGLAPKLKPTHKTDPYAGMYRFQSGTGKESRSSYLTFRVLSEKSTGWIYPAQPPLNIAHAVTERLAPLAEAAFTRAVQLDVGA